VQGIKKNKLKSVQSWNSRRQKLSCTSPHQFEGQTHDMNTRMSANNKNLTAKFAKVSWRGTNVQSWNWSSSYLECNK